MDGRGEATIGSTVGSIDLGRCDGSSPADLTDQIHHMPCCIKYDGPCSISHYFKPKPSGFVIGKRRNNKQKAANSSEGNSDWWQTNAKFKNITIWSHGNLPSRDDALFRSFHWLDVAKSLHRPVTAKDLKSASLEKDLA